MTTTTAEATVRRRGDAAVIDLRGDINAEAEAALDRAWQEAEGTRRVLLNFAGADYINSTGIALIVGLLARARAERREVLASGLSEHYREIFEITRLADFMTLAPDEDSALGAGRPSATQPPTEAQR